MLSTVPSEIRGRSKLLSSLSVALLLLTTSYLATTWLPLGFGTNDDIVLKSFASGRYTGQPEYQLIYSTPLFGLLLQGLFRFLPNFDWYTFVMFLSQVTAITAIMMSLLRKQPTSVRLLIIAVGVFIFPKFLFPMQFTGAAILLSMAGMTLLFRQFEDRPTHYLYSGFALLTLGMAIRWEAGSLVVGIFAVPLLLATWKSEHLTARGLLSSFSAVTVAVSVNIFLNRFNQPATFLHTNTGTLQNIIDQQSEKIDLPQLSSTAHDLFRATGGLFWDRESAMGVMKSRVNGDDSVLNDLQQTLSIVMSRPYVVFLSIALLFFCLLLLRGLTGALTGAFGVGLGIIGFFSASTYLYDKYDRLPYRLLMPLWVGLIIIQMTALGSRSTETLVTRTQLRVRPFSEFFTSLGFILKKLQGLILIIGVFCCLTLGARYLAFYGSRQDEIVALLDTHLDHARCFGGSHSMVFAMYPDWGSIPGGDLVPDNSDVIFDFPIFDNGWSLHTDLFQKRLDYFKIERDDSIVRMLVLNDAAVITRQATANLLAELHNEENPNNLVGVVSITGCEIEAYRLRPIQG